MNIAEILTILAAATPLLLAALGELIVEKSGVLNLGIEGMMLVGSVVGFILALDGYSVWWCFLGAAIAGIFLALIFAFMVLILYTNQVATGLSLAIFGSGLSSLIGASYVGRPFVGFAKIGNSSLDYVMILSLLLLIFIWWFLRYTKAGVILRGVGENHHAAYAMGYNVIAIRFIAIGFGGAMAGIAGAYMSLISPHLWTLGLTAGRGWIALALVVFAAWCPLRLLVGAFLFGGISMLQYGLQNSALISIPSQVWAMLPYLATILVLVIISNRKRGTTNLQAPADLGKPFIISN